MLIYQRVLDVVSRLVGYFDYIYMKVFLQAAILGPCHFLGALQGEKGD